MGGGGERKRRNPEVLKLKKLKGGMFFYYSEKRPLPSTEGEGGRKEKERCWNIGLLVQKGKGEGCAFLYRKKRQKVTFRKEKKGKGGGCHSPSSIRKGKLKSDIHFAERNEKALKDDFRKEKRRKEGTSLVQDKKPEGQDLSILLMEEAYYRGGGGGPKKGRISVPSSNGTRKTMHQ